MFNMGLNLGVNVTLSSGKPLQKMAASPWYDSEGEIPVEARGSGIQTIDGFFTRTPFESQVDLQASYSLKVGGTRKVSFLADVFNLFNERRTLNYDQNTQLGSAPDKIKGSHHHDYRRGRQESASVEAPFNAQVEYGSSSKLSPNV
jgi:hypothetical protein